MKPSQHHESHGKADHEHRHGVIDPKIAGTQRGKWAVKWSFAALLLTALLQVIVVALSGSSWTLFPMSLFMSIRWTARAKRFITVRHALKAAHNQIEWRTASSTALTLL